MSHACLVGRISSFLIVETLWIVIGASRDHIEERAQHQDIGCNHSSQFLIHSLLLFHKIVVIRDFIVALLGQLHR